MAGVPALVELWCHPCRAFVTYDGRRYGDRKDDPVHVTPDLLRAHRETHQVSA